MADRTISEDLQICIHDICPCEMLRMVHPDELVALIRTFLGRKIEAKDEDFGHEEGRVDYVTFHIDGNKIYYQDCGLFYGDEYFKFEKGCPMRIIDEVLAVLSKEIAGQRLDECRDIQQKQHKKTEIGGLRIASPFELIAESDEGSDMLKQAIDENQTALAKADAVLKKGDSYFNDVLKNYKRAPELGEALIKSAMVSMAIDNFVKGQKEMSEVQRYLLKEFFAWKAKTTGFESPHKTFKEKIESNYKALSTARERGWGDPDERRKQEIAMLKQAVDDLRLVDDAIANGERLYPELKELLKNVVEGKLDEQLEKMAEGKG